MATAGWTSGRSSPTGSCCARALKVLDKGVLVGEPPNLWFMQDTNDDLKADTKELVTDTVRPPRGERRAQRQCAAVGARQLDSHVRGRHVPSPEERQVRGAADARARPVGRVAGRRGARVPELQRVGAPRRSRAHVLLRAQSRPDADARAATSSSGGAADDLNAVWPVRPTRGVNRGYQAGILRDGRQPGAVHGGVRADRLPRRSAAGGAGRQRVRRRAGGQSRQPDRRDRRRRHAAGDEGLRSRGIHRLDRRAVPARLSVVGARRDAVRRRLLSRHHPAPRLHHRVPARSDPLAVARDSRSGSDASGAWCTTRSGAAPIRRSAAPRPARSSRRCRIRTAGGAIPRSSCSFSATTRPRSSR